MKLDPKPVNRLSTLRILRNRVLAGLFVVLPIFITYWVIRWLYDVLYSVALAPISYYLKIAWGLDKEEPSLALDISLSLSALGLVLAILFVAGMFFRSRLHHAVDWILLNVPGVNTVYSAVRNVVNAISASQNVQDQFKRVVLVEFPHPGMKAPAFVTGECQETQTDQTILSVYVPTTPIPTSGYMLLVAKEDVIDLDWDLEETLQAIVSGGITVPKSVNFFPSPSIAGPSSAQHQTDQPD